MSHSSKLQKIRKNVYLKASATNTTLIIITLPSAFINYSFVNIIYFQILKYFKFKGNNEAVYF